MKKLQELSFGSPRSVANVLLNIAYTANPEGCILEGKSYAGSASHSCYAQVAKWLLHYNPELTKHDLYIVCFGDKQHDEVEHCVLIDSRGKSIVNAWPDGHIVRNGSRITGFLNGDDEYPCLSVISVQSLGFTYLRHAAVAGNQLSLDVQARFLTELRRNAKFLKGARIITGVGIPYIEYPVPISARRQPRQWMIKQLKAVGWGVIERNEQNVPLVISRHGTWPLRIVTMAVPKNPKDLLFRIYATEDSTIVDGFINELQPVLELIKRFDPVFSEHRGTFNSGIIHLKGRVSFATVWAALHGHCTRALVDGSPWSAKTVPADATEVEFVFDHFTLVILTDDLTEIEVQTNTLRTFAD